jgi:hypothetical protein
MIGGVIANTVNAGVDVAYSQTETFATQQPTESPARSAFVSLVTMLIVFAIILFIGKYLWNNVLHVLVPGVKEAKSVWQILGLAVLISLLSPGGM